MDISPQIDRRWNYTCLKYVYCRYHESSQSSTQLIIYSPHQSPARRAQAPHHLPTTITIVQPTFRTGLGRDDRILTSVRISMLLTPLPHPRHRLRRGVFPPPSRRAPQRRFPRTFYHRRWRRFTYRLAGPAAHGLALGRRRRRRAHR